MNGWGQDLLVNLGGTFIGAVMALGSGWLLRRHQQRLREIRLVQDLMTNLYWKRALSPANQAGDRGSTTDEGDLQRCTASILDARRRIGEVANHLSVCADLQPRLEDMQTRCVAWLNFVETRPGDYVTGLVELRSQLLALEATMVARYPRLKLVEPGDGDVHPPRLFN